MFNISNNYYKIRRFKRKKHLVPHLIWIYIFLIYIYSALDIAGIGSVWDIGQYSEIIRLEEINLILFNSDGILTYILNIIMFMPLGFLLPLIWKEFRNPVRVFLTGVGFSLVIEICQLFNHRATDIDDLIMNSLGAIIGYFIWVCANNLFNSINKKAISISKSESIIQIEDTIDKDKETILISKNEAIIYLILSVLGEFFLYNWYIISS
ncbi:VanZ family protein [Romboutsia sp. MSSM.1001216sp_RTP31141st1_F12_RTP31141_220114]|uniref:VanZ family protein n=1 Tax=Romboutsia sp. MSSM.1001216sp_RTP31141st1_F12_RTP31141_220114 TaxID=3141594 RepID=UPI0031B58E70